MSEPDITFDHAPDAAPPAPDQPQHIGRYRIERVLGKGGFGIVYLGYDEHLRRLVAIKVPHARLVAHSRDAEAYLTEARTVANLDHPNIVPVHDVGSTAQFPCFIVAKYIDGTDLATRVKQAPLSLHEAVALVATVAEALHHAHRHMLVHRDIKPGNILLERNGKPFVSDFGLALREQDQGRGPHFAGTPAYMSPEQARGEGHRVDARSDVFSLGVVLYELLVGRRPFRASSQAELLELIAGGEARPPRQMDDQIPKELDRICLKALSKRARDRYSTAKDLADDLRQYLAEAPVGVTATFTGQPRGEAEAATPLATPATPPATDSRPVRIVPKGLRSFDATDADFFLELLPGPRDRDDLPEGIRFWKTRIEATDPDATFAVGLVYGPSGCGKSSLIKAGLLPRLARSITAVYVEAASSGTEARLLNALRRLFPELHAGNLSVPALPLSASRAADGDGERLTLSEALAGLRRGGLLPPGQKVLLVLDQFEQWLHAADHEDSAELIHALRHCDGVRLQCLVLVRDDFGMAATRFMRALEIPLVEGNNFATVDLFDLRHARKVLAALGRAFGELPPNPSNDSKEQKQFIEQSVAGLAQDNKVVSVRLALFAEMVKGKAWTPATLRAVGGTAGVGVTFLEGTFTASTAPPPHRLHQKAAQAVLKTLLPAAGTDLKGNMRSHQELLEASGYAERPADFAELLRILDGELRLITPTDPEGKDDDAAPAVQPGTRYYQLTHDYLVPSLRDWLSRKQKETRRGRAELLLADRAAVWQARPENQQLPSLGQWLQIRWFTAARHWTAPQRQMLGKAGRYHALRGLAVAVVLALCGWGAYEAHGSFKAHALRDRLLVADTAEVPFIIRDMAGYRRWLDPLLHQAATAGDDGKDARKRLHASLALVPVDPGQVEYLYARLLDAQPHEVPVIRDALEPYRDELVGKLWAVVETPAKGKEAQRLRAAAALAKYDPASERWSACRALIANDLVQENPVYLGQWSEAFRPVQAALRIPLTAIFLDTNPERAAERTLATNLLADYAADDPHALAELLMDADERQFVRLYPLVERQRERCLVELAGEIDRALPSARGTEREVLSKEERLSATEPKVKGMRARRYPLRVQRGKTYQFVMESAELDAMLILQDRTGKELASDDSGGAASVLIAYTAPRDDTYVIVAASAKGVGAFQLRVTEFVSDEADKERLGRRQANAAIALLRLHQPERVWRLLKHVPEPRRRSYLIHRFAPCGVDAQVLIQRFGTERELDIRQALLLSLGVYAEAALPAATREALVARLQELYRLEPDPGLHAAAEWLLRTWRHEAWLQQTDDAWARTPAPRERRLAAIQQSLAAKRAPPQWYVNSQGQTMIVVPGPVEFVMGSPATELGRYGDEFPHRRRIPRSFAVAAKPVTMVDFQRFNDSAKLSARYASEPQCPAVGVTWHQAAAYCNWLSARDQIPKHQWCYETTADGQVTRLKEGYLSLLGYRLPTEAELEFATRAGTTTSWSFGNADDLLRAYSWHLENAQVRAWPVGTKMPNDLGLFDVHGQVWCWCQEPHADYPRLKPGQVIVDAEGPLDIVATQDRALRGGSYADRASDTRSASRYNILPTARDDNIGFRPARTLR